MNTEEIKQFVLNELEEMKAVDIRLLDVKGLTSVTDYMVIASGTSSRHVKSITSSVVEKAKKNGCRPFGIEGEDDGEWALVDLGDVVVHVMLPSVREFYQLEKLWGFDANKKLSSES
ncbi:MAG: ribosome silencing factor [Gammaproteobacteria bacterium]